MVRMTEARFTESEWRNLDDLRKHWDDFCQCDPFDGSDTFADRMEAAGYIEYGTATQDDVEDCSFPEELGISLGGGIYRLTPAGRLALQEDSK